MAGATILVVEDVEENLRLIHDLLALKGYQVLTAMNAEETLALLKTSAVPDLILMDLQLPNIDGLELSRLIRSQEKFKHIPIFALTAYAMQSDKEKILKAGLDGCITKPINTRMIDEMIKRVLENRK